MRAFVGGAQRQELAACDDQEMLTMVREELSSIMGIKSPPEKSWIFRWPLGMPQYIIGHLERLEAIDTITKKQKGLYLTGAGYRGIGIPDFIVSDAHTGLRAGLKATFNASIWQRCQFHLQQNAQDYVTKQDLKSKVASDIAVIFNADSHAHAEERLRAFIETYRESQPKLAAWAEENLPEGLAVFALPEKHRKRMRTSNACETLNSQIKRRTRVVGLFPNEASLLRLVTAVLIEISDTWETGKAYLKLS
jgi:transposase-like protein